jgi:hypothetical protein
VFRQGPVRPRLERDPHELLRRLQRQQNKLISQPPRAWCIALRATDRRLSRFAFTHHSSLSNHHSHSLQLTSDDLATLTRPIHLSPPGQSVDEVAQLLGTSRAGLLNARVAGVFRTHYVSGLAGHHGKLRPLLYTDKPLDPASRFFAVDDPAWAATARHLPGRIPPGIKATLTRIPTYRGTIPAHRYQDIDLHPEHPSFDPPKSKSKKLPKPPPDYVWYKWKGDQYLGYDWRAAQHNPLIRLNYLRHEVAKLKVRRAAKARRKNKPKLTKPAGSLLFRGYKFLCPQCDRPVNMLYFPLPRVHLLHGKLPALAKLLLSTKRHSAVHDSSFSTHHSMHFACKHCHQVKYTSVAKSSWGEIVAYLSAGLLYGNEVPRPTWLNPKRKYKYTPRLHHPPSKRRPQIEKLLLDGRTIDQCAAELGLAKGTILFYCKSIYQQHGVRCLKELLIKHGKPLRKHLRGPGTAKRGEGSLRERLRKQRRAARSAASPEHAAVI